MKSLLRNILPTGAKTLSEEIIKIVVTALLGAVALGSGYLLPIVRSWLGRPVATNAGLLTIGVFVCLIIGAALMMIMLKPRINRLTALAATDDLTGCFNSREVKRRLSEEASRSKRQKTQFSFILIDIDALKLTNDTYGYSAGDDLLKEFARLAKSKLRLPDVFGRYRQGDEFVVLALDTDAIGARVVTERLRGEIERYQFYAQIKKLNFKITFSAGIAAFDHAVDSTATLEKHAELALAVAKRTKNVVTIYDPTMEAA